jgi:hypothetical protein
MSRHFLKAAALSFATGVALLSAAPALAAEPTLVDIKLGGKQLNLLYMNTTRDSAFRVVQEGKKNLVDSHLSGTVNRLQVHQFGQVMRVDAEIDGVENTLAVQQKQLKKKHSSKQEIQRGMVEGNYIVVYHAGGFASAQITSSPPDVGRLGR